ncbi:MAG TPA: LuxR C-terminal-related transcriptional regulator [Solirubrobacteraceae bacterium]
MADEFRRRAVMLDHVESTAGMGSWEWAPGPGEVVVASANLYRLHGLEPGRTDITRDDILARVHPDDRQRVADALPVIAAEGRSGDHLDYRFQRPDGTLRAIRAAIARVEAGPGGRRRLIGSVQDVSLQRGLNRQLAAHIAVTQAIDNWTSFEQGSAELLRRLSAALDVAFSALWVPDGSSLRSAVIWHQPSPTAKAIAELTQRWRPGLGSAIIGRAFTSRQPVIASDASEGGSRERNAAVRKAGLKHAVAVPAVSANESLAVLEFLALGPVEPMDRLLWVFHGIGHEIGHFLSHVRGELVESVLTPRQLEILTLAAHDHSAAAIATELHLSPATIKRHFARAYRTLGVDTRAAAVAEAMRRGLIR